jgi:hypothetical protein
MAEHNDIYVRVHTIELEQKARRKAKSDEEPIWPRTALVLDCETRLSADQSLTFGFSRFCEMQNGIYVPVQEITFYDQNELTGVEAGIIRKFARATAPETAEGGSDELVCYPRFKFVHDVLGKAIQAKSLIVGFNLPFDLSRFALDWEISKSAGWSLILSQWRNPDTNNLDENKFFPRLGINALNSKTAIFQSMQPWKPKNNVNGEISFPRARFLDLRTTIWSLRNKSFSLQRACQHFEVPGKLEHRPTGTVNLEEIQYCRQDVRATVGLLNAVKQECDLHPIDLKPDKMFSPASVAKAYLDKLNVHYPSTKVRNADSAYGIAMQSYFGGRSECRIRNWEVPVCPVDFMSQYPTVNELLDNGAVLTAKNVRFDNATQEIRQLLSRITLNNCFSRKLWPEFKFFALVRPDEDILPVRSLYNGITQNIGINFLTSRKPIWFAGPDIIASILLTGKTPRIEKAIRVVPHGKQIGLGGVSLRGMVGVDAKTDSFFKHVIEQRAANESIPALHYWLKILANSGSYGLFVELNPNERTSTKLAIFSGEESFKTTSEIVEEPGKWFAPHIGSLITSGGRLLLAMLEKCISDSGGNYLFCDTDSAAIVSAKHRKQIEMPDGTSITALSWAEVQDIVDGFETLNPYDPKLVPGSILKVHKLNWDRDKQRRQLFGYSIAAKRYAMYTKSENDIEIVEPKAHGLGYFYPPKDSPEDWKHETPKWIFEAWDWIMRGVLGLKRQNPTWFDLPVMMKLTLSTPHHALRNLAKGPLTRPHNFMMLPQISRFGHPQGVDPNECTLVTSFCSERDQWMNSKCINIHDSESPVYELTDEYDGRKALVKNFFMLLDSYQNHPEAKSLGPDGKPCDSETRGLLQRAHIVANSPLVYIGKESDKHWEEGEDLSLLEFKAIRYTPKGNAVADDKQLARIAKVPKREFIRRGINQHTLEKICAREPVRAIKLAKCSRVLEEYLSETLRTEAPGEVLVAELLT